MAVERIAALLANTRSSGDEWVSVLEKDEHKAKLLRGLLGIGRGFDAELAKVVKLRNDVDHVKDIVRSKAELKQFVEHLETAEAWLKIVKNPSAMTCAVQA